MCIRDRYYARAFLAGFGRHAQCDASLLLERVQDTEEVVGAWIPPWTQHPMQAFARLLERQGELLKPDGGINQIAEDGLAHSRIAGEISIQRLRKQRLTKARITLRAPRYRVSKLSCEGHSLPAPCYLLVPLRRR